MTVMGREPAAVPNWPVPEGASGSFNVYVGGYQTAGIILHVIATVVTLGLWLPVFVTYLIGWRRRPITVSIQNGVLTGVWST